jgi:hypothetical protein
MRPRRNFSFTVMFGVTARPNSDEKHAILRFSSSLLPGQSQLISVPAAVGEPQPLLRIRRLADGHEVVQVSAASDWAKRIVRRPSHGTSHVSTGKFQARESHHDHEHGARASRHFTQTMPYPPDMDPSQTVAPQQPSRPIDNGRRSAGSRRQRVGLLRRCGRFRASGLCISRLRARASERQSWRSFLDTLERPDNAANPARNMAGTFNSRLCCTDQDAVKVDYEMVVPQGGKYPEPEWYVWIDLDGTGVKRVRVPPEKIVEDYAPTGQAYAFVLGHNGVRGWPPNSPKAGALALS